MKLQRRRFPMTVSHGDGYTAIDLEWGRKSFTLIRVSVCVPLLCAIGLHKMRECGGRSGPDGEFVRYACARRVRGGRMGANCPKTVEVRVT